MRLLYIATKISDSGGVSRVLSLKLNYLADVMENEVLIFSTNDASSETFFPFSSKIKIHYHAPSVNGITTLFSYKNAIQKQVRAFQPDCVVVADNGIKGLMIASWMPQNMPCVFELHASKNYFLTDGYQGWKKILHKQLVQLLLPSFDAIVTLQSNYRFNFISEKKQFVIANPVSFSTPLSGNLSHQKAIAVGRQVTLKGYERMLNVWKKVVAKHPTYQLEIYGAESEEISLEAILESLNLTQNVKIYQPVKQLMPQYLTSDFLVHASYSEAFPMVFLEAMQCGLPILYMDFGGIDFLNENNSRGSADAQQFYASICDLIESPALRLKLGTQAKLTSDQYQLHKIMPQWVSLFKDVKNNKRYRSK